MAIVENQATVNEVIITGVDVIIAVVGVSAAECCFVAVSGFENGDVLDSSIQTSITS